MNHYIRLRTGIRIPALSGLTNRMVEFLDSQDLSAYPDYVQIVTKLKEEAKAFNAALNQEKAQSKLADKDNNRDNAYRSLYQMLHAYTKVPATTTSEPASKVFSIFERYGLSVVSMAYDEESGMIDSLLKDLSAADIQAAIEKLAHIATMVENLQAAEAQFKEASNRYDQNRANEKTSSPSATKLKIPLLKLINDHMVSYHTAMADFKDDAFRHIADTINGMILSENKLTRSRAGKSEEED